MKLLWITFISCLTIVGCQSDGLSPLTSSTLPADPEHLRAEAAGQFQVARFCSELRITPGPFEEQRRSRRCTAHLMFDESNALLVRGSSGSLKRLRPNNQTDDANLTLEVEPEANATFAESRRLEVNGPNYFLPTVGGSETGPSSMPVARTVTFASYPPPASARQWFGPIAVREDEATVWLRPTFDDYDADRSEEDARLIQLINQGRTPYVPIAHEIGLFLGDAPSVLGTLSLPRQGGRVRATFSRDGDAVFGNFDGGVCWRWNLTRTEFETLTCSTDLALASVACATCAVEGWQIVQIRDARNDLRVIKEVNSQSGAQRARLWSRTRNETLAKLTIASKARPAGIDFDTDVEISDDGEWLAVVANNGEVFVFQIRDLISS